jgi:hypothetical protein
MFIDTSLLCIALLDADEITKKVNESFGLGKYLKHALQNQLYPTLRQLTIRVWLERLSSQVEVTALVDQLGSESLGRLITTQD